MLDAQKMLMNARMVGKKGRGETHQMSNGRLFLSSGQIQTAKENGQSAHLARMFFNGSFSPVVSHDDNTTGGNLHIFKM